MQYAMPRTFYHSRVGDHHISGMTTLNLTMPKGSLRAAPISAVSSRQYTNAITNLEVLHASAAVKAASEIIDEIGLHTEQCKMAAA